MEAQYRSKKSINSNVWTGLVLLLVGGALLLRQTGYPLPYWLFNWEMIVITVGVIIGARNGFRDFSWLIMIVVGVVFLSDDIWPEFGVKKFAIPIIIIAAGLTFIFAPKTMCKGRRRFREREHANHEQLPASRTTADEPLMGQEAVLDIASIFAGVKKNVLSKQFRGGEIVCVFGGAEVNLTNSDFQSPVVIEVVNVFGGTKLIVPANWEVRSEVTAIFGGVDDKRYLAANIVPERVLIIKGVMMFGGIEIGSF